MPPDDQRLSTRLGISDAVLLRAFDVTRPARSIGAFGSAEGDMAAVVRACGLDPDPERVRELTATHLAFLVRRGVQWYDDALPSLDALRSRGIKTAIISNCDHWTRPVATAMGLAKKVDTVVLSFEVGLRKPDAAIYRLALERLGVAPKRALFVDDLAEYCAGAAAIGIQVCCIARGAVPSHSEGTHPIIRSLADLL